MIGVVLFTKYNISTHLQLQCDWNDVSCINLVFYVPRDIGVLLLLRVHFSKMILLSTLPVACLFPYNQIPVNCCNIVTLSTSSSPVIAKNPTSPAAYISSHSNTSLVCKVLFTLCIHFEDLSSLVGPHQGKCCGISCARTLLQICFETGIFWEFQPSNRCCQDNFYDNFY